MKMSDILRDLAELLDQQAGQQAGADMGGNLTQSRITVIPTDGPGTSEEPQLDKMVPPLQQKLELLKKVSGVASEFDNAAGNTSAPQDTGTVNTTDELTRMKQMAGIHFGSEDTDHE